MEKALQIKKKKNKCEASKLAVVVDDVYEQQVVWDIKK